MVRGHKILFDRKLRRFSTAFTRSSAIFSRESLLELFSRLQLLADDVFANPANLETMLPDSDNTTLAATLLDIPVE